MSPVLKLVVIFLISFAYFTEYANSQVNPGALIMMVAPVFNNKHPQEQDKPQERNPPNGEYPKQFPCKAENNYICKDDSQK